MRHTPGKPTPAVKRASGHTMTRARIAAAAISKMKAGETIAAQTLWNRIETQESRPMHNQRQKRKARRQLYAAGVRRCFAFA